MQRPLVVSAALQSLRPEDRATEAGILAVADVDKRVVVEMPFSGAWTE